MRVVALLPAATDIVCALGAADALVGVTHECDADGLAPNVPRATRSAVDAAAAPVLVDESVRAIHAGGAPIFALDEASIAAARPDLILTQALCDVCAVSEGDVRALASRLTPSPRVVTLGAQTLDAVFLDIAHVASAMGLADEGDELIAGLRSRLRTVHLTLKAAAAPRPFVAVIEWTDPVYVAGHWVPDMIKRAGGLDVLAQSGQHSVAVPPRAVADASPAVVVIAPCGYGVARARDVGRELLQRPEWQWARTRSAWAMDANRLVSRPGPHLIDGVEAMARMLSPALFSPVPPDMAVRLT